VKIHYEDTTWHKGVTITRYLSQRKGDADELVISETQGAKRVAAYTAPRKCFLKALIIAAKGLPRASAMYPDPGRVNLDRLVCYVDDGASSVRGLIDPLVTLIVLYPLPGKE
jgi:hypothetical protein